MSPLLFRSPPPLSHCRTTTHYVALAMRREWCDASVDSIKLAFLEIESRHRSAGWQTGGWVNSPRPAPATKVTGARGGEYARVRGGKWQVQAGRGVQRAGAKVSRGTHAPRCPPTSLGDVFMSSWEVQGSPHAAALSARMSLQLFRGKLEPCLEISIPSIGVFSDVFTPCGVV